MEKKNIKILLGMSGGVDSAIAAFLLKQEGYEVVGATMKIWPGESSGQVKQDGCYGPGEAESIKEAAAAAARLGIEHHVIDLTEEYRATVLAHFRAEYAAGRTPNPCVVCNQRIKFGFLLEKALASGLCFDYFATGHYARVERDAVTGWYSLLRGIDRSKDQSYFLYRLDQAQLACVMFPLGDMRKAEVKELARVHGLADYAAKKESQNFVECGDYASLLPPGVPGPIVDPTGKVLGGHRGIAHYTVGQRKLGLGGLREPYYVIRIDAARNTVIVGPKGFAFTREVRVADLNWIAAPDEVETKSIQAKLRSGMEAAACHLRREGETSVLVFDQPQFAPAPGQSAVFYDGDIVLGGGKIS